MNENRQSAGQPPSDGFSPPRCGSASLPPEPDAPATATHPASKVRVLIVDDDPVSRKVLQLVLARLPECEVSEAVDGRAAEAFLEKGPRPDLCICDFRMPGLDGIQLLERIRANPNLRQMEVIFCTATSDKEVVVKAASLRVATYLRKPLALPSIQAQLRTVFDRIAARRQRELDDLQTALGFDLNDCAEVLRELSNEILATVRSLRISLAEGKMRKLAPQMNALKGSTSVLHDHSLEETLGSIDAAVAHEDLSATLSGLDALEQHGRQLQRLVAISVEASRTSRSN